MENEQLQQQQPTQPTNDNQQYIDAIKELQATTVPKAKYDAKEAENKQLLDVILSGDPAAAAAYKTTEPQKTVDELRQELFHPAKELNNLQFVEKALELRDRVLEETGEDCFVSKGPGITPTAESYANAEKVANIYRECIEYADGDSSMFTSKLMSRMQEIPGANIRNKTRR